MNTARLNKSEAKCADAAKVLSLTHFPPAISCLSFINKGISSAFSLLFFFHTVVLQTCGIDFTIYEYKVPIYNSTFLFCFTGPQFVVVDLKTTLKKVMEALLHVQLNQQ